MSLRLDGDVGVPRPRRYHLWLVPSAPLYHPLSRLILALSARYGGPRFEPHVTLVGGLEGHEPDLLARLQQLGRELRPWPVLLAAPDFRDRYFQCLYLTVIPSRPLLAAREAACQQFGVAPSPYLPHLSLLYGWFPVPLKQQIIATLPSDLAPSFLARRIDLIRADRADPKAWYRVGSTCCK